MQVERKNIALARRAELVTFTKKVMEFYGLPLPTGVNDYIVHYYREEVLGYHADLYTYNQWMREGYKVKKGESSYTVWGRPLELERLPKEGETSGDDDNPFKWFTVCHLFANHQVEKMSEEDHAAYLERMEKKRDDEARKNRRTIITPKPAPQAEEMQAEPTTNETLTGWAGWPGVGGDEASEPTEPIWPTAQPAEMEVGGR